MSENTREMVSENSVISRKKALVIFDMDGTLFQTQSVTIPAVQDTLSGFGLPVPEADAIASYIGRPVPEYHAWLASLCPPGLVAAVIAAADRREIDLVREVGDVFPGVHSMLDRLRGEGYALAMSSNAPEDYFDAVLDTQVLRAYFHPALCRGARFAGKVEIVGEILAQHATRLFAVVGDRKDDIESARAHGGRAIAVTYGFGSVADLENADAHVDCAAAIPDALTRVLNLPRTRSGNSPA
ncbi:MAG: HAD family hydrolase [Candidatus Hydrogenedentes bacterium]|nr:HAD family hydrolase [Candidatus Hydrogenedentota bacterium]